MDNVPKHDHTHNHVDSNVTGIKLLFIIVLNFATTAAQVIGGLASGSLSLISDALHNFSDGVSIIISYLALSIARKNKDASKTFGYKRATILAALLNSSVLIVIAAFLFKEAYERFLNPQVINGSLVIWVALAGLLANIIGVVLLHKNAKGDMNLRASYLHLVSDSLSSVGVVIGGILIYFFKIYWVDPLLTVLIALYVITESYKIVKKAVHILMQGVPENIDTSEIIKELEKIKAINDVHHVHVWSLDEKNLNFEAHITINDMLLSEANKISEDIEHALTQYGINHVTIQFECECCNGDCYK
ncbi:MAG: cation transporter [Clostridiales bacterium]|nr:cation transporter [Clostridiales bacterium]